jgi:hypothetical protein
MSNGPGYTVNDLAFYGCLIPSLAVTHVLLMNLPAFHEVLDKMELQGFTRLIAGVISLIVGVAVGGAAERTLRSYQRAKKAAPLTPTDPHDYRKDYHEDRGEQHDPHR